MQDVIERDITVKATPETVYTAMTDPKQITQWFPDAVEGKLEAGESPVFSFGEDGKVQLYVEAAKPFEYFSFRWIPGSDEGKTFYGDVRTQPNTLIEFIIEPVGESTKVIIKESGFATLAFEDAQARFEMNNGGWDYMMDRLAKVFA